MATKVSITELGKNHSDKRGHPYWSWRTQLTVDGFEMAPVIHRTDSDGRGLWVVRDFNNGMVNDDDYMHGVNVVHEDDFKLPKTKGAVRAKLYRYFADN